MIYSLNLFFSTPQGYQNPVWAKTGREMRLMADAFAKTKEREKIRKKAQRVCLIHSRINVVKICIFDD